MSSVHMSAVVATTSLFSAWVGALCVEKAVNDWLLIIVEHTCLANVDVPFFELNTYTDMQVLQATRIESLNLARFFVASATTSENCFQKVDM